MAKKKNFPKKKKSTKPKLNYKAIRRKALTPPKGKTVHKSTRELWKLCTKQKAAPKDWEVSTCYYWLGVNCGNCKKAATAAA